MIRTGCYDIHERVKDMNRNGVLGSMCFPSFVQFCGQLFSQVEGPRHVGLNLLRAYNDWHIDEWCGTYPGRFIPLSIPPIWDPQLMADEVRRVAKKGCHAVTFSENPYKLGWPHIFGDHWDPFFAACEDEGTVICLHIGSSVDADRDRAGRADRRDDHADAAQHDAGARPTCSGARCCASSRTCSSRCREGGTGWIPYWLERIDYVYQQHRFWTHQDFGDTLPSQVARDHFTFCFISDRAGVEQRDAIGIDSITWECDYPHSDSTWPNSPESVAKQLDGVPDDESSTRSRTRTRCASSGTTRSPTGAGSGAPRERCGPRSTELAPGRSGDATLRPTA